MTRRTAEIPVESFQFAAPEETAATPAKPKSGGLDFFRNRQAHQPEAAPAEGGPVSVYQIFEKGKDYPPGSMVLFPLSETIENPRNPRVFFDEEDLKSLQLSIAKSGQQEAAKLFWDPASQKWMFKSGHRRSRALAANGDRFIKGEVVERKEVLDEFREARELNTEAKGQSHLDDAVRFPELMAELGLKASEFAARCGMSEGEVSKRVKIGGLPRELIDSLAHSPEPFGVEACYRIAQIYERRTVVNNERVSAEVEAEVREFLTKLIERSKEGRISVAQLQALAKQAEDSSSSIKDAAPAGGKRKHAVNRQDLKGSGKVTGVLKGFDNRLELKVDQLTPELRERIYDKLVAIFQEEGLVSGTESSSSSKD